MCYYFFNTAYSLEREDFKSKSKSKEDKNNKIGGTYKFDGEHIKNNSGIDTEMSYPYLKR